MMDMGLVSGIGQFVIEHPERVWLRRLKFVREQFFLAQKGNCHSKLVIW
jgi:hypothetical protein